MAEAFSARISPTSEVPSEVGKLIGFPWAVWMTLATSRIPPKAFRFSSTDWATSVATVKPPSELVVVDMVFWIVAMSAAFRAASPPRIHFWKTARGSPPLSRTARAVASTTRPSRASEATRSFRAEIRPIWASIASICAMLAS